MGKMQRDKGAAYERYVAKFFSDELKVEVKRRLGQAREGGHDIEIPLPLVIEVKRRKRPLPAAQWLDQACDALDPERTDQIPLVVTRGDNSPDLVVMYATDFLDLMHDAFAWRMTR